MVAATVAQVVAVVVLIQSAREAIVIICIRVGILFVILFLSACSKWSDDKISKTIEVGNELARSLEEYKVDKGDYPSSLEKLIPDYQSRILSPSVGSKKWDYTKEYDGYYLGVYEPKEDAEKILYRTHNSREWSMRPGE